MDVVILLLPQKTAEVSSDYLVTDITVCSLIALVSSRNEMGKAKRLSLNSPLKDPIITAGDVLQILCAHDIRQLGKKHIFSSCNADYVQKMVVQKEGVLILPDFIARPMAAAPMYRLVPLESDIVCRLVLATKRNSPYSRTVKQLQNHIRCGFEREYKTAQERP